MRFTDIAASVIMIGNSIWRQSSRIVGLVVLYTCINKVVMSSKRSKLCNGIFDFALVSS